jgi:ketosteroid isomerase-like protein
MRRDEMEGLVMSDDFETITGSIAEAFTRQDAEGIAGYYTDDAQVLPPDAPLVEGREGLIGLFGFERG